tara:strand:- start:1321 stop:1677 length:357 start_codon:yes stop_codon:yes gene_type:complete
MIDTDKYEGHTSGSKSELHPSGWWVEWVDPCTWYIRDPEVHLVGSEANRLLIQDAPLLLEEVKRLRKELDEVYQERDKYDGALNIALEHLGYQGADHEWFCREKYQCNVYGDDLEEEE